MDKPQTAPSHLKAKTCTWWVSVVTRWELESHHIRLLTLAAECWDRGEQARALLARDGLTTGSKSGGLRTHPAVRIEADCRVGFARLLRELDLDVAPPAENRRPPALRSIAR
jgi:phage terminase small subunit